MLGMWHVHAPGIVRQAAAHPDEFSFVGFYDRDAAVVAERTSQWQSLTPGFRVFESVEELLRQPIDGVVVEGRVDENLGLARLALEAGKPVLLEKPPGVALDEYSRLLDEARRRNLHVQLIYLFRYMTAIQELLRRARRGDFGRIYEFRGRLPKDPAFYDEYVEQLARYRGGIFFEMAGHLVDLAVFLCGKPRQVLPLMRHHASRGPAEFEDNGVAVLEFEHAFGIIEVPALEAAPATRRIEVYGDTGACVVPHLGSGHMGNNARQPIEVYKNGAAAWETVDLPAATLQISDLREFAAVVTGCKPPDFSMEHDLIVQETLLRACGALGIATLSGE